MPNQKFAVIVTDQHYKCVGVCIVTAASPMHAVNVAKRRVRTTWYTPDDPARAGVTYQVANTLDLVPARF